MYRVKCEKARRAGRQYTLTILPHFLLPGCLIRADDVFDTGMDEDIRKDMEKACARMGALEKRTVRRHLSRFDACLGDFVLVLAAIISGCVEELPERAPEIADDYSINLQWFRELFLRVVSIRERLYGFEDIYEKDIAALFHFFIHPAYPAATRTDTGHNIFSFFLRSPP